jgi:hypothetical protein
MGSKLATLALVAATAGLSGAGLFGFDAPRYAWAGDDPAEVVRNAYKIEIESFNAVGVAGSSPWDAPNRDLLFTSRLSQLFATDERYMQDSGELGNLDFDPFLNGQDGDIKALTVETKDLSASQATVNASFDSFDTRQTVRFMLVRQNGDWRIDDIIDPQEDGQAVSVAGLLSQPYKQNPQ